MERVCQPKARLGPRGMHRSAPLILCFSIFILFAGHSAVSVFVRARGSFIECARKQDVPYFRFSCLSRQSQDARESSS